MSQVTIQSNASGTGIFTIASPNSNTNQTLTLPNATGTVFVSGQAVSATTGTFSGNVDASGTVSAVSPNNGTTGAVRILDASGNPNAAYLQFVDNNITLQYGYIRGLSAGGLDFNGSARIDSSSNLLVGKTATDISTVGWHLNPSATGASSQVITISSGTNEAFIYNNTSTGGNARVDFRVANVSKGNIQWNNTNTAYNTTSDYRLKENIQPMTGALAKVAALKPCTYKWNADGSDGEGFIAHELQAVVPQCVTGEKDAVDAEGNPVYQGIDTSFLVATLTAAIQEQQAIITALTARIEALEAK